MRLFLVLALAAQFFGSGFFQPQTPAAPAAAVVIYDNSLAAGWQDWSWSVSSNFSNTSPTYSGGASIKVTFTQGWDALQLVNSSPSSNAVNNTLEFWISGGSSGGQVVQVSAGNDCSTVTQNVTLAKNTWTKISLSLAGLGTPAPFQKIVWYNNSANSQAAFYIDAISLTSTPVNPPAVTSGPALSVNASAERHAISPLIYGLNFPDESLAAELHLPIQRWGGNSTTRYNWKLDTHNTASDWYFENIPADNPNRAALPDGSESDLFIEQGLSTGTPTLLTVPMIGWTPKDALRSCGFSISKYGAQKDADYNWEPDCGNGVKPNSSYMTGNDPKDTSVAITSTFVKEWVQYLVGKYGSAASGGVKFYNLDNEPMLWNSTHRDVHPQPTSYDELRDRSLDYAAAIKAADPTAQILGPVEWGWTGYFYSALDEAPGGDWWNHPQDRLAHGNTPFVEWYLQQMHAYEQAYGLRLLDYLDLHYYPQAFDSVSDSAGDLATQQLRLESTRGLWDTSYNVGPWINEPVYLLPRMQAWVNTNYPGTKTAVSEYSWGAMCHYSGALAQADVLGISGQQGLDLATLWGPPGPTEPGANAFRLYRSADSGRGFGETSVQAASANRDDLSIFAAQRSLDGALTLMVINKTAGPLSANLTLSGFAPAASARAYRFTSTAQTSIVPLADQAVSPSGFQTIYPAYSITLYILPPAQAPLHSFIPAVKR